MRVAGDQSKRTCGNLQLCVGLKDGIEGATYTVGLRRLERLRVRRSEEDERITTEEESVDVETGE